MLDKKVSSGVLSTYITNLLPVGSAISLFNSTASLILGVVMSWVYYNSPSKFQCTFTGASFDGSANYVNDYCYNQIEIYNLLIIVVFLAFLDYAVIQLMEYHISHVFLSGSQIKMLISKYKVALNTKKDNVASHYKKPLILDSMTGTHKKNIEKILCVDLISALASFIMLSISAFYILKLNDYNLSYSEPRSCIVSIPTLFETKIPVMCYSAFSRFANIISAGAIITRFALLLVTLLWCIHRARKMSNTSNAEHIASRVDAYCDRFEPLFKQNEIAVLRASLTTMMKKSLVDAKVERNKQRTETLIRAGEDYNKFQNSNIFHIKDL